MAEKYIPIPTKLLEEFATKYGIDLLDWLFEAADRGWTRAKAAEVLGINRSTLAKHEREHDWHIPWPDRLRRVERVRRSFHVGQRVQWGAVNGSVCIRTGNVYAIVPPGKDALELLPVPVRKRNDLDIAGEPRSETSYVVRHIVGDRWTISWPLTSSLRPVDSVEVVT